LCVCPPTALPLAPPIALFIERLTIRLSFRNERAQAPRASSRRRTRAKGECQVCVPATACSSYYHAADVRALPQRDGNQQPLATHAVDAGSQSDSPSPPPPPPLQMALAIALTIGIALLCNASVGRQRRETVQQTVCNNCCWAALDGSSNTDPHPTRILPP
jgi:hypothetical protein